MYTSRAYREQQVRIARRAAQRATRRYRVPAVLLFAAGLAISAFGEGPGAVSVAVLFGMGAVFLYRVDSALRRK